MAIQVFPPPNDGPLSAQGPSLTFTIGVTGTPWAFMSAHVKTTSGTSIRLEPKFLPGGVNKVRISLPRGGVPPGSKLKLVIREANGAKTVVEYDLR